MMEYKCKNNIKIVLDIYSIMNAPPGEEVK
jgi:hypothetical protein